MPIITGGIKFEKGKEIPQKMKDFIKENGIKIPFKMRSYSNTDLDSWLRIKQDGKKIKFDRIANKFVEDKQITEQ